MSKIWKFVKNKDITVEKVPGRNHFWHYDADFKGETDTIMVRVVIPKNEKHSFHRHPEMNEVLYILKGTAEQWVEDEMQLLNPGDSVYIDADVVHATFNSGVDDLEFLAVLSPRKGWRSGTIDESENLPYKEYRKDI